jgi:hypothetical protein
VSAEEDPVAKEVTQIVRLADEIEQSNVGRERYASGSVTAQAMFHALDDLDAASARLRNILGWRS